MLSTTAQGGIKNQLTSSSVTVEDCIRLRRRFDSSSVEIYSCVEITFLVKLISASFQFIREFGALLHEFNMVSTRHGIKLT